MVPCPELFRTKLKNIKFHLFDFHKFFDCLLGLDNLKLINAKINLVDNSLDLPSTSIRIYFQNINSKHQLSNELNNVSNKTSPPNYNTIEPLNPINLQVLEPPNPINFDTIDMNHMNSEEKEKIIKL